MNTRIIDSAVRLPSENGTIRTDTWFELAAKWGISHSVVAPPDNFVTVYNEEGNAQMVSLMRQFPDRLSGLAVANPWYDNKAVAILRKAFEGGLRGLYMHPARQGFHLTEDIVNPLVEVCIEYDKPIYSHTGTPVCAMPFQLAELARRFPEAVFVMGHMGWTDFCGYDAIPAAQQAKNIIIETSCTNPGIAALAIHGLGVQRVIFGTGYPQSLPPQEFEKIRLLALSQLDLKAYVCGNATRLWRIGNENC